ncbi:hypothetical protein AL013_02500 [Mariprofundus ferrooxydans]|nr:hypothetical protein AL013_02500 [Mariprofundus ferrooxydans]
MQWIGGPSKDLGEKEGAGKFAAVGSTGANKLENAGSQGALRDANKKGKGGGGGGSGGGSGETTDDKLDKIINKLEGGGAGSQPEGETLLNRK